MCWSPVFCVLDSHGVGAGLSPGPPQDLVPRTKGIIYPCFLWASSAPLSTATWTGDISQHHPQSMIPSRGQRGKSSPVSFLGSPLLLYSAPTCPPSKGKSVLGIQGFISLQDYPRIECSQVRLGSSCAQVSGTTAQAPSVAAAGLLQAMKRGGLWLHSQELWRRENADRDCGVEEQGVGKQHGLGSWAVGLSDCFLLRSDKAENKA